MFQHPLGQVESILKGTALPMDAIDSRAGVLDPFIVGAVFEPGWDTDCGGRDCDAVGAGLVQADAALSAP